MKNVTILVLLACIVGGGCADAPEPGPEGSADVTEEAIVAGAEDIAEPRGVATTQGDASGPDRADLSPTREENVEAIEAIGAEGWCYTSTTWGSTLPNACGNARSLSEASCALNGYTHVLPPGTCTGTCYPWGCRVSVTVCCY